MFYDKGSYSAGWRYMEAAPSDQSAGIGGFASLRYWSSSEDNGDSMYACDQDFSDSPSQFFHHKSTSYHVRAVRAF